MPALRNHPLPRGGPQGVLYLLLRSVLGWGSEEEAVEKGSLRVTSVHPP